MAAQYKNLHTVLLIVICICIRSAYTVSSKIDPKCVVDDSKPAAAPDNYMDCNTTQARKSNRTSCCNIEDEIVCCDGETGANRMVWIGGTIAGITVALATCCFIVFWCETKYVPCLKPCLKKYECCRDDKKADGETEMADIAVKMRHKNREYLSAGSEFAVTDVSLVVPEEIKATVDDKWWSDAPLGSTSYA